MDPFVIPGDRMPRPAFLAAMSIPFIVAVIPAATIFVTTPTEVGQEVYTMDSPIPAGTTVHTASMPVAPDSWGAQVAYGIPTTVPVACDKASIPAIEG
ncbi:hypothetical protein DCC78_00170 [bacterium]|nr:MAG: hypothetical protein DCC78_00170 [bacterium]